jgi:UDPglucose--hexose-1-phosphate uridylyltransferase
VSPELRIDPLSGLRVIVAGERGSRPGAFLDVPRREPIDPEGDPFAAGHEDRTPPELYRLPGAGGSWRVRVVPNLYPALEPGGGPPGADPLAGGRGEPDLFASQPATGKHEVIVNAPDPVHCTRWPSSSRSRWRPPCPCGASACGRTRRRPTCT